MKTLLWLAVGAALVLALPVRGDAQGVNVAGEWAMTVNTDNGAISATLVLKQDGEKITGSIKGDAGEMPLEGTIKEQTLTFGFTYPAPDGNALPVTMTAKVEGDTLKGTFDAGGMMAGEWTATKKS
jgi:hypothetical protein